MARVVVVGAGVGGLAVAIRLAVQGHEVRIVEQSPRAGGKLETYDRGGFRFDTGPSLLTLPAVYRDLFLKSGQPLEDEVELVEVDPAFRHRFADGTEVDLPNGSPGKVAAALDAALGEPSGTEWLRLIDRAHAMWKATRGPVLESPVAGARDLARLARRLGDLRVVAPGRSLHALGARQLSDPRARQLLDRYATYTGSDPRSAPAVLATIPYVEQTFGAWHVTGGLGRLGEALHRRALDRGVDVRLDCDVTGIELDGGRASGVRLADGARMPADVVVSDVDATALYGELLPAGVAVSARRRLQHSTPSFSGFTVLLALRGGSRPDGLSHHTVLFPRDYEAEFDTLFGRTGAPVDDPSIYVCAPDDATMSPDGSTAVTLLVNAPRHGEGRGCVDWTTTGLAESYADRVLSTLARRGVDLRDRVDWREVRTPADLAGQTRSPGGAIYGTASHGVRGFLRAANRSPVPGLFLVGGSAHPGGGLPLVGMSAAIVADLVGRA